MAFNTTPEAAKQPDSAARIATAATYLTLLDADLARAELEMVGIEAWTANAMTAQDFMSAPLTGVSVQVAAVDLVRAQAVLNSRSTDDLSEAAEREYAGETIADADDKALLTATTTTQAAMYDDAEAGGWRKSV